METNKSEIASMFREAAASPDKNNAHIIASNGHWKLVKEGNQRATFIYPSKEEAVSEARKYAKSGNAKVVIIHKTDGTVDRIFYY
jgi:hypothetical protein